MQTPRYVVQACPYGLTGTERNARWQVVDTRPEIETYETVSGATMTETKPPPWRQIAYCTKRNHANLVAFACNAIDLYGYGTDEEFEAYVQTVAEALKHV